MTFYDCFCSINITLFYRQIYFTEICIFTSPFFFFCNKYDAFKSLSFVSCKLLTQDWKAQMPLQMGSLKSAFILYLYHGNQPSLQTRAFHFQTVVNIYQHTTYIIHPECSWHAFSFPQYNNSTVYPFSCPPSY